MDVVAVQTIVIRKEGKFAFFIIMTGGIQKQLRKDFILFSYSQFFYMML